MEGRFVLHWPRGTGTRRNSPEVGAARFAVPVIEALGTVLACARSFRTPSKAQVLNRNVWTGPALNSSAVFISRMMAIKTRVSTWEKNCGRNSGTVSGTAPRRRRKDWPPPCSRLFTRSRCERLPMILRMNANLPSWFTSVERLECDALPGRSMPFT